MLSRKRNSLTSVLKSLGPPLRNDETATSASESLAEQESEVADARKQTGLALSSYQHPPLNTVEQRRGKENVFHVTPLTQRAKTHDHGCTPNSTYPHSNERTRRSSAIKEKSGQKSTVRIQTPSSTFPASVAPQQEDVALSVTKCKNSFVPHATAKLHFNGTPQIHNPNGGDGMHMSRSKSVPKQLCSATKDGQQKMPPAIKQPMIVKQPFPNRTEEIGPTNGAQGGCPSNQVNPVVKPLVLSPPEEDKSVLVLRSGEVERRFKKVKLIGSGGSSKVYKVLAVDEDFKTYALKEVYVKHVDPAIKMAYVNEIKLLKKLRDKPGIITLYDYVFDKQEGILYLLLEYGEMDLNALLKARDIFQGSYHMNTTFYIWIQMLRAVKVIHDEGVIHNDLKPENFVCIGLQLCLIDFGIANRIETEKTSIERDIRCGTINYMAPETIETYEENNYFKVGRPSDIWSLGCILYQLVYGKTPFEHIKNKHMKWKAITDPSIAIPFPEISNKAALDIMQRCLCRNPKERPTIDELLEHPFTRSV